MTAFAEILGTPPTLEWVPVGNLKIDDSYQREASEGRSAVLINQIARGWDWRVYQPLSVSKRGDGAMYVVDGQHRLAAALHRGDIPFLPVVITSFVDAVEEAGAFEAMNRQRKPMTRLEQAKAAAVAGDPATVAAVDALRCAGLKLARHTNTDSWKAGEFGAIGAVVRGINKRGRKVVEAALVALAEAFPGEPITKGSTLLQGLILIYAEPPEGFDPDLLIDALGNHDQDEWVERARFLLSSHASCTGKMPVAVRLAILSEMGTLTARQVQP